MPIYEVRCLRCGRVGEVLVTGADAPLACPSCGSPETEKLLSAPSALSGRTGAVRPGPQDHGCCGSRPQEAGCAGPGSCCGKAGL
ncbi:MAG: FmdB family zinc ribbon protein [Thermodesulfobacteriota bacterium]